MNWTRLLQVGSKQINIGLGQVLCASSSFSLGGPSYWWYMVCQLGGLHKHEISCVHRRSCCTLYTRLLLRQQQLGWSTNTGNLHGMTWVVLTQSIGQVEWFGGDQIARETRRIVGKSSENSFNKSSSIFQNLGWIFWDSACKRLQGLGNPYRMLFCKFNGDGGISDSGSDWPKSCQKVSYLSFLLAASHLYLV